ncbi:hypothetical protein B0I37DRAFT_442952 [Chaetomium sp. MPI-CAGE-AT-0009]|nr:hypothetical protein B0I37DRAFT_442952 [Chaetomium sp. MPI-CAGE-AT-0009]
MYRRLYNFFYNSYPPEYHFDEAAFDLEWEATAAQLCRAYESQYRPGHEDFSRCESRYSKAASAINLPSSNLPSSNLPSSTTTTTTTIDTSPHALSLPTTHLLALLTATTITLLRHPDLSRFLLYWLARGTFLPRFLPAPLRRTSAPANGMRQSPYWATLHALRWQEGLSGPAVECLWTWYVVVVLALAGTCPAGVGEAVLGGLGWVAWPCVRLYLLLVVVTAGVRGARWLVWFAREVVSFVVWAVLLAVREVVVLWAGFLRRYWAVIFASWAGWVSWRLVTQVDYGEVAEGTVVWLLYRTTGLLYWAGDVLRDMARSISLTT